MISEVTPLIRRKGKKRIKNDDYKLDTFSGVFLPTSLNVLLILMFLRFGLIIGQLGILGTFSLLLLSYSINILTTMSISAISTNGTVKGGGAYYMISRSLGPEFGGAIGIIFFFGQILNSSLNVVGLVEPLLTNFNDTSGIISKLLPTSPLYNFLYSSLLLLLCVGVALVGAELVAKTALALFITLFLSTISIPISTFFVQPFGSGAGFYSGLSLQTFKDNFLPHFTSGAAGSVQPLGTPENFRNLFGIFYPATAGIFAGAAMSGDLKNPSKSIPLGTIKALVVTFFLYSSVIISMGSAIPRGLLYLDIGVIQTVNIHPSIVIAGELATSMFSVIMGIVGAATILNAIADDKIIPGIGIFSTFKKSKEEKSKAARYAVIFTWFSAQVFLLADINQIATFITMAFLMTFIVTNIACFLLKIGSAPNFRPSFKYFSTKTAFTGAVACLIAMFIVDGLSAAFVIFCLLFLIVSIHYTTPPSQFGDISQLLIYHQVRKYLLRLKLHMSVKYWRPQILLLVDSPRSSWNLIGFCNHLKKGGLYILGHVVIMKEDNNDHSKSKKKSLFTVNTYKEVQKQKSAWVKLRELLGIKAFVQIALGPTLPWGVRNVFLGSGLGGMRPNITVIAFYNFIKHGISLPVMPTQGMSLPTDACRQEAKVSINQWVQIVEDLIIMQATVAVAANFRDLDLTKFTAHKPHFWSKPKVRHTGPKKYIDLYPIQMSSINQMDNGKSILSTNFDTYTLILQLGWILSTVDEWKYTHILRVCAFVETQDEVEEETGRLKELLTNLRIDAELKIISLDDGKLNSYNLMVKGYNKTKFTTDEYDRIDKVLHDDQWWKNLCNARLTFKEIERKRLLRQKERALGENSMSSSRTDLNPSSTKFSPLNLTNTSTSIPQARSFGVNRRYTLSNMQQQGMSLSFNIRPQQYYNEDTISSDSSDDDTSPDASGFTNTENNSQTFLAPIEHTQAYTDFRNPFQLANPVQFSVQLDDCDNEDDHDNHSSDSSTSNLRPNFLALKMPQAQIEDDEDVEEQVTSDTEARPTIKFVEEELDDAEDDIDDEVNELVNESKKLNVLRQVQDEKDKKHNHNSRINSLKKHSRQHSPSIINNSEIDRHIMTPQFLALEDEELPSLPGSSANLEQLGGSNFNKKDSKSIPKDSITQKQLQEELNDLSFSDLPAKGQHIILNELMRTYSPKETTDVLFSTLPAPSIGTHLDDEDSFEYANNLAIWLDDLPPIMLLNSQTVTVTTAL